MAEPTDDDIAELLRDEGRRAAVTERRRQRGLDEQSMASGSMAGVLVDLAEIGGSVTVTLKPATVRHGVIGRLGAEVVELVAPTGAGCWAVVAAIVSIRRAPGGFVVRGDRIPPATGTLAGLFADLALRRAEVVVDLVDGSTVQGMLRAAGTDVVSVHNVDRSCTYVSMTAVAAVGERRTG